MSAPNIPQFAGGIDPLTIPIRSRLVSRDDDARGAL